MTSISLYGIGGHCCFDIDSLGGLFGAKFFDADGNAFPIKVSVETDNDIIQAAEEITHGQISIVINIAINIAVNIVII